MRERGFFSGLSGLRLLGFAEELVQASGVRMEMEHGGAQLAEDVVPFRLRQATLFEAADEGGDVLAFLSKLAKEHAGRARRTIRFAFAYCLHPSMLTNSFAKASLLPPIPPLPHSSPPYSPLPGPARTNLFYPGGLSTNAKTPFDKLRASGKVLSKQLRNRSG
jgi:hypothetical protein